MRHFTTNKRQPTLQERFQSRSPTPESTTNKPENGADGEKKEEEEEDKEEEDDYMNMTFTETPTVPETSLQRRQRLHAQGLKRGAVPSKAELLAQERARREEGLARSLLHPDFSSTGGAAAAVKKSKGLAMMAKMGFTPGSKLGAESRAADARAEPLRIEVREDRGGIGLDGERKRKIQEAAEAQGVDTNNKKPRLEVVDPLAYRDRMARERDAARKETLVGAAQKIAERMDEDRAAGVVDGVDGEAERERKRKAGGDRAASSRPLRAVPVLYRGLVRHREAKERDRRMRHDLETSLGTTLSDKLPAYEDEGMDGDDKMALGREEKKTVYMVADDLDDEDEELDEWEALEVGERLQRLVEYLRKEFMYCFWCKFAYPDESMEGCPGITEEDHD